MYIEQISVYVQHKPGGAAAVTKALGEHEVNILSMSLADIKQYSVMHLIVDDPARGFQVLKDAHFTLSSIDVLAIQLGDIPGEFSRVLELLGQAGYNVDYAYACGSRKTKDPIIIIRVDDVAGGSVKLLLDAGFKLLSPEEMRNI